MNIVDLPALLIEQLNKLQLSPLTAYQFGVQFSDAPLGEFLLGVKRIEGLGMSTVVRTVEEGGARGTYSFPRRQKNDAVRLVRGMTYSRYFIDWYYSAANWTKGRGDYRKDISIIMLYRHHAVSKDVPFEVWRWDVKNAWPSEWRGPSFNSTDNKLAFESVNIRHEGVQEKGSILTNEIRQVSNILL